MARPHTQIAVALPVFDYPAERSAELPVNGTRKFTAEIVSTGRKRACQIGQIRRLPPDHGRIKGEVSRAAAAGPIE